MSHLVVPKIGCVESRDNFARFVAEPLEKGIGMTLGNAIRRILLGQLQGAAVTRVKIEGIQHEFTTIPNVKEDVVEFLLNVKAIRMKPVSGRDGKLTIEVEGEKDVTAGDIQPSADFEIVNPDLHLATLDSADARLYVELEVELSKGYREADSSGGISPGVIPVDSIFSPVRKVNFTVEPVRIGQVSSNERLVLEVWTDGTISPTDAVAESAQILLEQISPFVSYNHMTQVREEVATPTIPAELASMTVEQLNLSVRTLNCLRRGGINTVGEIVSRGEKELLSLRNFGNKSKQELDDRLKELGLVLSRGREQGQPDEETSDLIQ
ncbi:MAG: DNA-directed RNA polymerase subunit alpha [Chloroflexi bacterium]|nr:DNA-directed RNA polymerase subunit alpha [Chloroflexota bacterium]